MSQNLSEQFYGELQIAPWITKALNIIKKFKKQEPPKVTFEQEEEKLDMWVVGPKDENPNELYLYGHSKNGSVEREIIYMKKNPNEPFIYIYCKNGYMYKLNINKSASIIAKKLDMLVQGAYTDIVLIHHTEILNRL